MESIFDFLEENAAIVIFCIALSVLFLSANSLTGLLVTTKNDINQNPVLYEQPMVQKETIVRYQTIIGIISKESLDFDLEIDGVFVGKETHDSLLFDYNQIKKKNYKESYLFDGNGSVLKVIYHSV